MVVVLVSWNWSWSWGLVFFLTIGLGIWTWSGFKKIEIGWKGQLLYLAERQNSFLNEGWRWTPFPFGIKKTDCRKKTTEIDAVKIFTSDNVEVLVKKISIVWQIINLNLYHGMDPEKLDLLLDDVVDRNVREKVRTNKLENVLGMSLGTENVQTAQDLFAFGIQIIRIIVPEIVPANPDMLKDVESKEREKLEKVSQRVEMKHFARLVDSLMKPIKKGGQGLTREQAFEQAQLLTEKATKTISGFTLNSDALTALGALLGRK